MRRQLALASRQFQPFEGSESIDAEKLKAIAEALGVSSEAIKNFSEEAVFNIIGNTFDIENNNGSSVISYGCTFNPLDKLLESIEKNEQLYERLIQVEREKAAYLEKLLKEK